MGAKLRNFLFAIPDVVVWVRKAHRHGHAHHHVSSSRFYAPPNEDFGRRNRRCNPDFRLTFQWFVAQIEYSRPWKVIRKSGFHLLFTLPKSSFGRDTIESPFENQEVYAPQTKILEGLTKDPCGKQHFREIPTPDFVRTLRPYPIPCLLYTSPSPRD